MGRVTFDQNTANPKVVPASGVSLGADHVDLLVDGVSQGRATHPGWADSVGAWSASLNLQPGSHTLTANAVHPSGQYTATASSTFTVPGDGSGGAITCAYDDDGNVTSRTWATGRVQTLTWDAFGRLIKVVERNATQTGYDWSAVYDGLGRRLKVTEQTVAGGTNVGSPTATTSIYDPQVEFLEIGVAIDGTKAWKVYGPDLNGWYGSLQGTGGLEATIVDTDRTTKGVISDQFGNGVGSVTGGVASWFATRVSAYGPLPGMFVETLTDITRVAEATVWRGHRVDATNFVFLGARYYEPTSGRFLSTDPKGHGSSMSLYDFANGDPVNYFDPTGRLGKLVNRVGSDGIIFANDHVYRLNPNRVNDPENLLVATLREMGQQLAATAQYDARILNAYFIQPPLYVLSELNHGAKMLGESVGIDPTAVNLFMMDASMGATALPKLGNLLELGATETTAAAESKVLVIGENMSQRVVPYAEKIGAEIYPGMPGYKAGMQAEALLDNGLYIEKAKDLGYRIIDIGPDFARRAATGTASEGYQLERFLTKDYTGYEKAFTR
jgi:RHS repeat-associated protein